MSTAQIKSEKNGERLDQLNREAHMAEEFSARVAQLVEEIANRCCGNIDIQLVSQSLSQEPPSPYEGDRKVELGLIGDAFGCLSTIMTRLGQIETAMRRF